MATLAYPDVNAGASRRERQPVTIVDVYGLYALRLTATPPLPMASAMSRNYYSEIHLHIVWHTKNSLPLLTPID